MAFLRLAGLASLLAVALSNPVPGNPGCEWPCKGLGTAPAVNWTALCTGEGEGYCNLGAYMTPNANPGATTGAWTNGTREGDIDIYLFDHSCNVIGQHLKALSSNDYYIPLKAIDSELPMTVVVDTYNPPDGYGAFANLKFSYSTWSSSAFEKDDKNGNVIGDACYCTQTGSSTEAQYLQVCTYYEHCLYLFNCCQTPFFRERPR